MNWDWLTHLNASHEAAARITIILRCCPPVKRFLYYTLCILGVLTTTNAGAASPFNLLPDRGDAYLSFYLDNDLFAGTDENYTNGARLAWLSGARDPEQFGVVQRGLRRLTGDDDSLRIFQRISGFRDPTNIEYNYGTSITQLMFTPQDPDAPESPPGESPYAGWLGLGFSLHAKDSYAINSVELSIGTVGPNSQAREAQDFIHKLKGVDRFKGWDSQIPNEPTLNLFYSQKRRMTFLEFEWGRFAVDGFSEWGAGLGTFRTDLYLGALTRFGWNLPVDFSDPRLSPTAYSHQPFKTDRREIGQWSFYGLFGLRGSAVAHDITLDGPVFNKFDTGATRKPFIGGLYAGFGLRYRDLKFTYVQTYRSRRFKQQNSGRSFGSIAVSYRF